MNRPRGPDAGWWAALLLIGLFGLWPWRELWDQLPWGADATKWIAGASLDNPGWWEWCTQRKHFVGWRPVTAFTFLLDHALFGYDARGYRGTDLALHAASAAALYGLWRTWTGDRGPAGLVPLLVLLGHPATEEVVPYVARRSYLLASGLGLAALIATVSLARSERRFPPAAAAVAALLGLAVAANEVAFVILPLLPVLVWLEAPAARRWPRLLALAPTFAVAAAVIGLRHAVLGVWGGGYARRYFAYVHGGRTVWTELPGWEPGRIAAACWSYLLDPISPAASPALAEGVGRGALLAVVGGWLAWRGLIRPFVHRDDPDARRSGLLALWLVGATAIVVLSQTWFWRQAYTLLPPLGLLLGLGLRDAARAVADRRWTGLPGLGAGAALLAAALYTGPLIHGMDQRVHTLRLNGAPVAEQVRRATPAIPGPGTVYLVVPVRGTTAQIVRLWGDRYGADRGLTFRVLAQLGDRAQADQARARVERDGERPALVLDGGLSWSATTVPPSARKRTRLELDQLWRPGRRAWVMVVDGDATEVAPIPRPPEGTDAPAWEEVEEPEADEDLP